MFLRKLLPRIFLVLVGLLLFLLITQRESVEYFFKNISDAAALISQNIQTQMSPPRKFVGTRIQKEDSLKMYIGEPFMSFNPRDWEEFWKIVYGVYAKENPNGPRFIPLYRQLDYDEMQIELREKYPTPFLYLQGAQWEQFWKMIFSRQ